MVRADWVTRVVPDRPRSERAAMQRPKARRGLTPGVGPVQAALGPTLERRIPAAFGFLRRHCPVLSTPRFALVVGNADVRQVLARRDEFAVIYTHKVMEVTGPFALGFDDATHHDPARALLAAAVMPPHPDVLPQRAAALAADALGYAAARGRIDVLGEFLDPVLARLVGDYLGVTGLDWPTLVAWAHTVFTEIFESTTPFVRPEAMKVVLAFRAHIDGLIAARKTVLPTPGPTDADDVLARMLAAGIPDQTICGTLLGLVVAWIPNTAKMLSLVIDELLDRPPELAKAQAAARAGDRATLVAILSEAARFRPQALGILRVASGTSLVGLGSHGPKKIRAGALVLASTASAMMDEEAIEAPREFRVDRPDTDYLHFGYGLHTCAGAAITWACLPELAIPLLSHGPLRRARGRAGRMQWRYPYPSRLVVRFAGRRERG